MDIQTSVAAGVADGVIDQGRDANAPTISFNLIGWAACNSTGLSVALSIPLWIPDFPARVGLGPWSGGAAATTELAAATLANILWSAFVPRYPPRWVAAALALILALAQQAAASSLPMAAFGGLAVAGLGAGSLLAIFNKQVAHTDTPHRGFAILAFLHVVFQVLFFVAAPRLQARYGPNILFNFLSVVDLIGCFLTVFLPRGRRFSASAAIIRPTGGISVLGLLGLIGLAVLLMGHEALSAYLVRLGQPLNLTRLQVGSIFALASAVGLGGTVLAGILPAKAGYARLIVAAILGVALLDASMSVVRSPVLFAAAFVMIQTFLVFSAPRIFSYLAVLDRTGRTAGMSPASLLVGSALGPILASAVGAPRVIEWVPLAACASSAISLLIFVLIGATRKRRWP